MGGVHLSSNPTLAMDGDPLDSHTTRVWHQCEWAGPLDRLYIHTNGLGLLAMDEGVKSMGLGPNLIFRVVPYRSFNPLWSDSKMGPPSGPHKNVLMVTPWEHFSLDHLFKLIFCCLVLGFQKSHFWKKATHLQKKVFMPFLMYAGTHALPTFDIVSEFECF